MARKNLSLLKGTLTVIILALLIYVILFFFFPDISLKYFGDAYDKKKALENTIVSLLYDVDYMTQEEKDVFEGYLKTEEGKKMVESFSSAVSSGQEAISSFVESSEFQNISSTVKEALSPDSFSRLMEESAKSAEKLYSWYKK